MSRLQHIEIHHMYDCDGKMAPIDFIGRSEALRVASLDEREAEKRALSDLIAECRSRIAGLSKHPVPMPGSTLAKVDAYQDLITWATARLTKPEQEGPR